MKENKEGRVEGILDLTIFSNTFFLSHDYIILSTIKEILSLKALLISFFNFIDPFKWIREVD